MYIILFSGFRKTTHPAAQQQMLLNRKTIWQRILEPINQIGVALIKPYGTISFIIFNICSTTSAILSEH